MADLTQELPVEKLNEESWAADKNERRAKVASRTPTNSNEKSIYRQMGWSNTFTDHLGDVIRQVKNLSVDNKADSRDEKFFNEGQKKAIIEKLRASILANNKNAGYLTLAKDYGYEAADDFESNNSGDITMDDSTATMVDKFAKKYAARAEKSKISPYKRSISYSMQPLKVTSLLLSHIMVSQRINSSMHFIRCRRHTTCPLCQQYQVSLRSIEVLHSLEKEEGRWTSGSQCAKIVKDWAIGEVTQNALGQDQGWVWLASQQ